MTAHKHFKALVRARMKKTGESYSTARRMTLNEHTAASAAEAIATVRPRGAGASDPASPKADGPARFHVPGSIPATTALRVALTAAGGLHPATHSSLSEPLLFAIAGGIGIGVAQFFYEKEDFASFFLAGRHLWQDDQAYLTSALARLGVSSTVLEAGTAKAAEKNLRAALAAGAPCIAWLDMAHLPHRAMPSEFSGGGYHVITVYDLDEAAQTARIGDLTDSPISLPFEDLAAARARIKKFKQRVLSVSPVTGALDLAGAVRAGLRAGAQALTAKPSKSAPKMFSLDGLRDWAERLHGATSADAWPRVFAPGARLWTGLCSIHEFIEYYGTGGGLCRPLFATALHEAAEVASLPALHAVAAEYDRLGAQWCALAEAALPADVPLFSQARELYVRRHELTAAAAEPDALPELQQTWQALAALKRTAAERFPLSEKACDQLCAALQERVRSIHEQERAAVEQLRACVE